MIHSISAEAAEEKFGADMKNGLTRKEAASRLSKYGKNKLSDKKGKTIVMLFFEQFNDFLILILIAASCISFFTNIMEKSGDIAEPIVILAIVVLNALLGVIQEKRAEKSLEALKKMTSPSANVIRDSAEVSVPAEDVCVGDLLVLRSGDVAASDVRLTESINLEIDESSLTGESVPVSKDSSYITDELAPLAERRNMVYAGTYVTGGRGKGIVTACGMDTEVGKIAQMLSADSYEMTPLQKKLEHIGKALGICALSICALVFVIGVWHHLAPFDMFVTSISLAVAAIPEGLPAIVTIMLSLGMQRMAKCGAIVRNLPSVETLGSADVICSDKTGTLTKNIMTVQEVFGDEKAALCYGVLCTAENTKNPTELAVINAFNDKKLKTHQHEKKDEQPFSSVTKQMRVLYNNLLTVKGAPEIVLKSCGYYLDNGKTEKLTDAKRRQVLNANKKFAEKALRVIAVAYKQGNCKIDDEGLVFCGLIAMSDPPREDAIEAVRLCQKAGIKTVMITGDHMETARAVASQVNILKSRDECISGKEIDKMSDEEFEENVEKYSVFARTSPEHKVKIVKALKKRGKIVAMTGDGVNDAPALKAADIGCSLGKTGTEVAKESSDIVLTDDNFATIVKSVRMGREIYENIKKSVKFLLSSNIGEIITVFFGILLGLPTPLLALQLLWVNLVTDSLPAIALGVDPCDEDVMLSRIRTDKLFTKEMVFAVIIEGLMIGALGLLAFCIGVYIYGSLTVGRTMAFCVLSLSQLIHSFNIRSEGSVIGRAFFKNKLLVLSLVIGAAMQIGVVCFLPELFGAAVLSAEAWKTVAALSVLPLVLVEIQKNINAIRKNLN